MHLRWRGSAGRHADIYTKSAELCSATAAHSASDLPALGSVSVPMLDARWEIKKRDDASTKPSEIRRTLSHLPGAV